MADNVNPPRNIDEFLALLRGVKPQGTDKWMAFCPGHDDRNQQSLSVTLQDRTILLHCFSHCETAHVIESMGLKMADLFLDKKEKYQPLPKPPKEPRKLVKVYPYYDITGEKLLFEVCRYFPKTFRQRHFGEDGKYIWNMKGVERVIYRLPQIIKAIADKKTIIHVEGEKDVDNLVALGFEATTSPMGALSWDSAYAGYYTGAIQVVLFNDKDDAGRAYSEEVAIDLFPKVNEIKRIELPGEKVKDVSDWIEAGGTRDQLLEIIENHEFWHPTKPDLVNIDYAELNKLLKGASDGQYCVLKERFHRITHTREGDQIELPINNFVARIIEDILKDNGADSTRYLKIQGRLNSHSFPTVTIPESSFDGMRWVRKEWGVKARVVAGKSNNDHMINAINFSSSDKVAERVLYTHTGWREINGKWLYLTAGGAIGDPRVEVELPARLSRYRLPQPNGNPKEAIEKSLGILSIGKLQVTLPTFILPYLSVLNIFEEISFTPWFLGRSGSFKSVMMALAASHFGDFSWKSLPVNWFGTRTELEKLSFLAKDILLPIDDYAPPSDANSARDINRTVEYMIRDVGNRQGRVRSNADMSSQATFYPRGLIFTSGEQLPPPGVSRSARIFPLPIRREDFYCDSQMNYTLLTQAQQEDRQLYPLAMAHFIKWIQENMQAVRTEFNTKYKEYRALAPKQSVHLRMVEIVALMQVGLSIATQYAVDKKALEPSKRDALLLDGWKILTNLVSAQNTRLTGERPGIQFIEILRSLLSSGKVALRTRDNQEVWIHSQSPGPDMVGWNDYKEPSCVYLIPRASYQAVFNYCQRNGEYFGTHRDEVFKDLWDLDYLIEDRKGDMPTPTKWIDGGSSRVLQVKRSVLFPDNPEAGPMPGGYAQPGLPNLDSG